MLDSILSHDLRASREHLTRRQLAFESALKRISTGTVAIILLVTVALLSVARDNSAGIADPPHVSLLLPDSGSLFEGATVSLQDFGNKCAADR